MTFTEKIEDILPEIDIDTGLMYCGDDEELFEEVVGEFIDGPGNRYFSDLRIFPQFHRWICGIYYHYYCTLPASGPFSFYGDCSDGQGHGPQQI